MNISRRKMFDSVAGSGGAWESCWPVTEASPNYR